MNHLCFFKSLERVSWSYARLEAPVYLTNVKVTSKKVRSAAKTGRMSKGAAEQQPKADSWGRISTYHSEHIYQKLPI